MQNQHHKQPLIIPLQPSLEKQNDWKAELAASIYSVSELFEILELDDPERLRQAEAASQLFAFRVNRSYVAKIQKGDPNDPLLRQILPLNAEFRSSPLYSADPLGELQSRKVPGVLHKYQGRLLLIATGACALHCRYCFRREYPYAAPGTAGSQWDRAIEYIEQDPSIHEIILSGGDPLTLSDKKLAKLCSRISSISHIKRLRIHSRLPIVLPTRITRELINAIHSDAHQTIVVTHSNHPNEIDSTVKQRVGRLKQSNITVLNQSVLLKGINDHPETLITLSERLFEAGILPYYLHLLDKVNGTEHFDIQESQAIELVNTIKKSLSGYLVPKLVREIQGEPNKITVY